MATTSLTYADTLDARIKDPTDGWGSLAAWKDWLKTKTREELYNRRAGRVMAEQDALRAAALAVIAADDATLD